MLDFLSSLKCKIEAVEQGLDADLYIYAGEVSRQGYLSVTEALRDSGESRGVALLIYTYGGDPHAAYRIARAFRHHCKKPKSFTLLVPDHCKSAGTLLAIGASRLLIADCGELGPLDVQLIKPDELVERNSSLDMMQALSALQQAVGEAFDHHLYSLASGKSKVRLSAKKASEIASNLASELFKPIYAQIDPIRLGEVQRATAIAHHYGRRLNDEYDNNLKDGALNRLVLGYPSHSFVIDRKEARSLFKSVEAMSAEQVECFLELREVLSLKPLGTPRAMKISDFLPSISKEAEPSTTDGGSDAQDKPENVSRAASSGKRKSKDDRPAASGD